MGAWSNWVGRMKRMAQLEAREALRISMEATVVFLIPASANINMTKKTLHKHIMESPFTI